MSEKAYNVINAFLNGDKVEAGRAFRDLMQDKMEEAIEAKTNEVALSYSDRINLSPTVKD